MWTELARVIFYLSGIGLMAIAVVMTVRPMIDRHRKGNRTITTTETTIRS